MDLREWLATLAAEDLEAVQRGAVAAASAAASDLMRAAFNGLVIEALKEDQRRSTRHRQDVRFARHLRLVSDDDQAS